MQATLLSIAIAFILALVAALVAPHFIDWNQYRTEFETQASRISGLRVRIAGPIDARLLPIPSLNLQRIDISRPGQAGSLRAGRLSIEFSLGSLARGEFKASEVILEGAELTAALDRNGRLEWPAPSVGFDADAISIERLDIRDSRALLADAASGYGVVLDKFEFKGELRTLSGPVKGQGSFYADGVHYPYRIAASRVGDGRTRVRLGVDPVDRSLTAEAEGFLSLENGGPRFVGGVTLSRSLTRAPSGSSAEILEPWRLTGKIDSTSERAVVEQIEFQYGPDERPLRMRGDALVNFGASPRVTGVLSSSQIDLDRILALPEPDRHRPFAAIKAFADLFDASQRPVIPVSLGISVESLVLAGATLQRVSADFASEVNGWNIEKLELRGPGLSQLAMSGRVSVAGDVSFSGRTRLASKEPRALIAWLTNRPEDQVTGAATLSLDGDVRLARNEIAVERLRAELDRMRVEGRLAYSWGDSQRPPRIEAVLSAPDIDLDRAYSLLGLLDDSALEWPREGLLSAKIGRATLAGVELKGADVSVRFDAQSITVERLTVSDFGGASVSGSGTIDSRASAPRGAVTLELNARQFDGVAALIERIAPQAAAELRRSAQRVTPAKLSVALSVGSGKASAAEAQGQFKVDGVAGALRIGMQGDVLADGVDLTAAGLARLRSARVNLAGEIEAREGAALLAILGLERAVAVDKGAGRITVTARGPLDNEIAVGGRLAASGLDASTTGTLRLAGNQGPTANLDVKLVRANFRIPASAGREAEFVPAAMATRLTFGEGEVGLNDLTGTMGGTDIGGRLTIGIAEPHHIRGELSLDALHLPTAIAAMVGIPRLKTGSWPSEPFEQALIGSVEGSVKLRIANARLLPQFGVADMSGVMQFGRDAVSLEEISGSVAGGRVAGSMAFRRGDDGLSLDSHVRLSAVDLMALLPDDGALTGRATIDLHMRGNGRSPVALIGSLQGGGTFTVQDGAIKHIDPSVFAAVIRSVDEGLPIDAVRIDQRTEAALGNATLSVGLAQGEIVVAAGQLRLANTAVQAKGIDVDANLALDLSAGGLDTRLILTGAPGSGALEGVRPEIALSLRGPFGEFKRTLDVAAFANWLALRAIEEKDKRIDALQAGREVPVPSTGSVDAPSATTPSAIPVPARPPPAFQQQPKNQPQRPAAKTSSAPTDIRPPPAVRPQTPPKQAQPPASRSWLERLLNP